MIQFERHRVVLCLRNTFDDMNRHYHFFAIDTHDQVTVTRGNIDGFFHHDRVRRDSAELQLSMWSAIKPHSDFRGMR